MNSAYSYAAAALLGFSAAWYLQGLRWDSDVAQIRHDADQALVVNVDAVNQHLIASRAETERIRAEYLDYKTGKENETSALERCIATGKCGLRVKATCPDPVRATGAVSGRPGEGTAELTEAAGRSYLALRRGLDRQYAELQFCRSELRKRSAK